MSDVIENVMYAMDLDGTGSLHACSKEDDGARKFVDMEAVLGVLSAARNGDIDQDMRCVMEHIRNIE